MAAAKRGGRTAGTGGEKVNPTLAPDAIACLELLAKMGRYGSTKTAVAAYLIMREIDDLTRAGVLPKRAPE